MDLTVAEQFYLLKEKWKIKIQKKEEFAFYQKDVDDGISNEIRGVFIEMWKSEIFFTP